MPFGWGVASVVSVTSLATLGQAMRMFFGGRKKARVCNIFFALGRASAETFFLRLVVRLKRHFFALGRVLKGRCQRGSTKRAPERSRIAGVGAARAGGANVGARRAAHLMRRPHARTTWHRRARKPKARKPAERGSGAHARTTWHLPFSARPRTLVRTQKNVFLGARPRTLVRTQKKCLCRRTTSDVSPNAKKMSLQAHDLGR